MKKKPNISDDSAELRRRAELRLSDQRKGQRSKVGNQKSEADHQRQLHELEVHQIELEMQNEQLKEARDRMEALLEKYTDLYDFAPVGFLTLDREGAIREANLAGASLLGIARSAMVNRRLGFFVSPADRPVFDAFLKQVFESGAREECDMRLLVEGKHPIDARMRAVAFSSGRECRAAVTDITERKRAEEDRLILSKLESTGILAEGIAHDFNNLLTVILLNLELAQTLIPAGKELAPLLEQAKQAALRSKDLTRQFVTFAKGEAPIRELTCLSEVIRESARVAVSGSRVRCDFSLARDLFLAEVDAGQIRQVIQNLVLNARDVTPTGGVISIRAENVVLGPHEDPSLPPGDYVRVSIADRGRGISKEMLSKIFDPYFSTKEKGKQRGMGLGLAICHTIIQKHGGTITVESEPGVGTTFHLHLPASRKLLQKKKAFLPASLPWHGRILVMENEERLRKLVGKSLQRIGHEVELVEDAQAAVAVYGSAKSQGRPFDAVILDLSVRAGAGGQEAIEALLEIDPAVKAIVMSGYASDPAVLEPERHGFKGGLAKPFDIIKLQEILSLVMAPGSREQGRVGRNQ